MPEETLPAQRAIGRNLVKPRARLLAFCVCVSRDGAWHSYKVASG